MSDEDVGHCVVLDPVEPGLRVDLAGEVPRQEAVGIESARGHQDEDPERRITEAEALGQRFAEVADEEIDLLDVAVDRRELGRQRGVTAGQVEERRSGRMWNARRKAL